VSCTIQYIHTTKIDEINSSNSYVQSINQSINQSIKGGGGKQYNSIEKEREGKREREILEYIHLD
jgi:hypothetical protein